MDFVDQVLHTTPIIMFGLCFFINLEAHFLSRSCHDLATIRNTLICIMKQSRFRLSRFLSRFLVTFLPRYHFHRFLQIPKDCSFSVCRYWSRHSNISADQLLTELPLLHIPIAAQCLHCVVFAISPIWCLWVWWASLYEYYPQLSSCWSDCSDLYRPSHSWGTKPWVYRHQPGNFR